MHNHMRIGFNLLCTITHCSGSTSSEQSHAHQSIKIMPADKGGRIVVIDVGAYKRKAMGLLNDNETYERLVSNPLDSCNESSRRKIKQLSQLCQDKSIFKSFSTTNPSLSYFYGLPKIHKPQIPLRPIIANIGTVTRPLAGWLAQQLSPYLGTFSQSHIKNSQDYKGRLINFAAGNSTNLVKMVSLDVVSLFSKVPVDDVFEFYGPENSTWLDRGPNPMTCIYFLVKSMHRWECFWVWRGVLQAEVWHSNGEPSFAGDGRAFYGVFWEWAPANNYYPAITLI